VVPVRVGGVSAAPTGHVTLLFRDIEGRLKWLAGLAGAR
jgi:hypothetical protein